MSIEHELPAVQSLYPTVKCRLLLDKKSQKSKVKILPRQKDQLESEIILFKSLY